MAPGMSPGTIVASSHHHAALQNKGSGETMA